MSSAVQSVVPGRLAARSLLGFDLLFGVLPLMLLCPLLSVEFRSLWHRTAMTFFPIPIFIVCCLVAWHLRSPRSAEPLRLISARVLYLVGVAVFGAAVWRSSPFLSHCSLIVLFIGWATERLGIVPWPRVLGWAGLLATSIRLPGDLPTRLQNWFVQQSSVVLGYILDGLNIPFLILANTFHMRSQEFSLSEVCTSVYSVNALVCSVVLLLLLTHRSLLVAIFSLLTVPIWAFVQLVLVLLAMVLLRHFSERDATQGLDRALVELIAFMIIAGCCWATTWFLARLSLPVPAADSGFEPEFQILNSIACWPQPDPFAVETPAIQPSEGWQQVTSKSTELIRKISWAGALCFVGFGFLSTYRVARGEFANQSTVPAIRAQQIARIQWKDLFPEVFDRLRRLDVTHEIDRIEDSDRGVVHWNFVWQGQIIQLSVTLPFANHPRLAGTYESRGWRVLSQQAKQYAPIKRNENESATNGEPETTVAPSEPWTELRISNELGGQAFAIVTYHQLMDQDSDLQSNLEYQVVLFCESGEMLTAPQVTEFYSVFHKLDEHLKAEVEPRLRELLRGDTR